MIFGNHDYAVSDFQMILSVWNNDLSLTSDTGDQIIRLGRQVFKRNIGELAFLLNNKLYCPTFPPSSRYIVSTFALL